MDKLRTTITQVGSKSLYETKFTVEGDLKKIIDYLKTNKSPKIDGYNSIRTLSVKTDNRKIQRVMTCPLPDTMAVKLAIGNEPVNVIYDVEFDDNALAIVATNPRTIHKFFRFIEEITIIQISPNTLEFHRVAKVFNSGKKYISDSYQEYDDYYNNHTLAFCLGLAEISK